MYMVGLEGSCEAHKGRPRVPGKEPPGGGLVDLECFLAFKRPFFYLLSLESFGWRGLLEDAFAVMAGDGW